MTINFTKHLPSRTAGFAAASLSGPVPVTSAGAVAKRWRAAGAPGGSALEERTSEVALIFSRLCSRLPGGEKWWLNYAELKVDEG